MNPWSPLLQFKAASTKPWNRLLPSETHLFPPILTHLTLSPPLSFKKKKRKKYNLAWINDEPAWPITSAKCSPAGSSSHKALSDVGLAKRTPPSQAHNSPGSRLRGSSFPISSCQTDWLLRTANWVTELSSSWPSCLVPPTPAKRELINYEAAGFRHPWREACTDLSPVPLRWHSISQ